MNKEALPNVLSLVLLFISTLAIIIAGYVHGHMDLLTTLKNGFIVKSSFEELIAFIIVCVTLSVIFAVLNVILIGELIQLLLE